MRAVRRLANPGATLMAALLSTLALLSAFIAGGAAAAANNDVVDRGSSRSSATVVGRKGINGNELYRLSPDRLASTIASYHALGVQWVRFDFDWSVIQPERADRYELAAFDRVVQALTEAGIQILGIIDYTPAWANGGKPSKFHPPEDPNQFAGFAAYLAARYAPVGVHAWEIWNEPNLGQFWAPAPNVAAYAELLRVTYAAIHGADPDAIVVSGGLAQPPNTATSMRAQDFLAELYRLGGGSHLDAVGNHPYSSPALPAERGSSNWHRMFQGASNLRGTMASHGDQHKPIWITEYGAPTLGSDPYGTVITEARQAEMVAQAYRLVPAYPWAGPLFWYNLQDFCAPAPARGSECYYGLFRHDGSEKPAAAAYRLAPRGP